MRGLLTAIAAVIALAAAGPALAVGEAPTPPDESWRFEGPFGTFDRQSAQRGFQVYKEVCAGCHAVEHLAYRHLMDLGFSEAEVKAIAAGAEVTDGPNDEGEMFQRPARPSDPVVRPFANPQAARAANAGALPPDLSLIVKARAHGPDYVYHLLTGYQDAPADVKLGEGMYYNLYFPGHQIAMAPPLSAEAVSYGDGTEASVDQMARDVVNFLAWAAEPELEDRHRMGIKVILFLLVFTGLAYAAKRKVWADLH